MTILLCSFFALLALGYIIILADLMYLTANKVSPPVVIATQYLSGQIEKLKKEDETTNPLLFVVSPTLWMFSTILNKTNYFAEVTVANEKVTVPLTEAKFNSLSQGDNLEFKNVTYEVKAKNPLLGLALGAVSLKNFKRVDTHRYTQVKA